MSFTIYDLFAQYDDARKLKEHAIASEIKQAIINRTTFEISAEKLDRACEASLNALRDILEPGTPLWKDLTDLQRAQWRYQMYVALKAALVNGA